MKNRRVGLGWDFIIDWMAASPSGVRSIAVMGVATAPGAMALTRMPFGPSVAAKVRVSIATPAFVAE